MKHWALPSEELGTALWLVFDMSNGCERTHRYCWWFPTREAAREHIRWQKTQRFAARLSQPTKVIVAGNMKWTWYTG